MEYKKCKYCKCELFDNKEEKTEICTRCRKLSSRMAINMVLTKRLLAAIKRGEL